MNKYTVALVLSGILTLCSIVVSMNTTGDYQTFSTIAIGLFWIGGLVSLFLRGLVWYKQDLAKRAIKEAKSEESSVEGTEENTESS